MSVLFFFLTLFFSFFFLFRLISLLLCNTRPRSRCRATLDTTTGTRLFSLRTFGARELHTLAATLSNLQLSQFLLLFTLLLQDFAVQVLY